MKLGQDPNAPDSSGFTALHAAAREAHLVTMRAMVEHGAEPELSVRGGPTPLEVLEDALGASGQKGVPWNSTFTWGDGTYYPYRLGHGDSGDKDQAAPKRLRGLDSQNVVSVAISACHAMAVTSSGSAFSWGYGIGGRLGHGNEHIVLTPKRIVFGDDDPVKVAAVGISDSQSAFADSGGGVWTCGNGNLSPVKTKFSSGCSFSATQVACGFEHVVALSNRGDVFTWGRGAEGQLGLGNFESTKEPRSVAHLRAATAMVAAGSHHTLVATKSGEIFQWGASKSNSPVRVHITEPLPELEEGFELVSHGGPKRRPTVKELAATFVAAYGKHSAAIIEGGQVHRWTGSCTNPTTVVPLGSKLARSVSLSDTTVAVISTTGSLLIFDTRQKRPTAQLVLRNVTAAATAAGTVIAVAERAAPLVFDVAPRRTLLQDIAKLLEPGASFSDVTLRSLDGGRVPAHRVLLSRCTVFSSLEAGADVRTAATTQHSLESFVRLVYTGRLPSEECKDEVLRLAGELGLPRRSDDCHAAISGHLCDVLASSQFSDVGISCGDPPSSTRCHRAILGCRSDFFGAMLSSSMREGTTEEVSLEEMSPETLNALISFVYTDAISVSPPLRIESEIEILILGDRFLLPAFGEACLSSLVSKIGLDNVVSILEIAEKYSLGDLRRACLEYLLQIPSSIVFSPYLRELSPQALGEIVALAYQKTERMRDAMKKKYGPPLAKPKEEDPGTWGRDDGDDAPDASTPKKTVKKKKKEKKAPPVMPQPAPPVTVAKETKATAEAKPKAIQTPREPVEMFWGSEGKPASTPPQQEKPKKDKKKKPQQADAIADAPEATPPASLLVTPKSAPQVSPPAAFKKPPTTAEIIASMTPPKQSQSPWGLPASPSPKQAAQSGDLRQIQAEQQREAHQSPSPKKQQQAERRDSGSGYELRLGEALGLGIPQEEERPKPKAAAATPVWRRASQDGSKAESLLEIQKSEIAKLPPPPPPSRRWESVPVEKSTTGADLSKIITDEAGRKT